MSRDAKIALKNIISIIVMKKTNDAQYTNKTNIKRDFTNAKKKQKIKKMARKKRKKHSTKYVKKAEKIRQKQENKNKKKIATSVRRTAYAFTTKSMK